MSQADPISEDPEQVEAGKDWLAPGPAEVIDSAWGALGGVFDPELALDVVSLGLVYDIRADGAGLIVEMTLTTPGCPVSESLPDQARAAIVDATAGMVPVSVQVVWDPPWSPAMMSDTAAGALGFRPG